jgi:peroxiredoxin family protein
MRIIQEPKKVALWNKRNFEEKEMESVKHVKKIQYMYLLKKYKKWSVLKVAVCPSYI